MNKIIIGITGGSGSGKTTFVNSLKNHFGNEITHISLDRYYKSKNDTKLFDGLVNYDHPDAIDFDLFKKDISNIKNNKDIYLPIYDFKINDRTGFEKTKLDIKKVIILEGILLFSKKEIEKELDLKIFIDVDPDLRIIRRIKRDIIERNRTIESIINQYLKTVKPMHQKYVEPTKYLADIIIPNGNDKENIENSIAKEIIIANIEKMLKEVKNG